MFVVAFSLSANAFSLSSNAFSRASSSVFRLASCRSAAESCFWQEQIIAKEMSIVRVKSFLIIRSKLQLVFRNSDQENGRPTGSQTKLDVPTALAGLFSDRSNTLLQRDKL